MHDVLARANFETDVANLSPVLATAYGLHVHAAAYPTLDVTIDHRRPLRVQMRADNWDELPPSIDLMSAEGAIMNLNLPGGIFHTGPHPETGRPFVCMRGSLEYHRHSGHLNDHWDNYRGQDGMGLIGILLQIAHAWRAHA